MSASEHVLNAAYLMRELCDGSLYLQSDASSGRNVRSVKSSRIRRIAYQSDVSAFSYFRQNLLQPFLIERVSDTEGSRRVQQACNQLVLLLSALALA